MFRKKSGEITKNSGCVMEMSGFCSVCFPENSGKFPEKILKCPEKSGNIQKCPDLFRKFPEMSVNARKKSRVAPQISGKKDQMCFPEMSRTFRKNGKPGWPTRPGRHGHPKSEHPSSKNLSTKITKIPV